ncbi:MAG: hypothetical protein QXF76_04030 [Candidatus Anstonellales archaeon]
MKQHNFLEINFTGVADGSKLQMIEPFATIQGKRLKIVQIIKTFYASTNTVVEALSSTFPSLTIGQYKVATNNVKLPKNSLGWFRETSGTQYFNIVVNDNVLFNQDTTKIFNNLIDDVKLEIETETINSFDVFIRVQHFIDYTTQSNKFYPYVNIKIFVELI